MVVIALPLTGQILGQWMYLEVGNSVVAAGERDIADHTLANPAVKVGSVVAAAADMVAVATCPVQSAQADKNRVVDPGWVAMDIDCLDRNLTWILSLSCIIDK